MQSSNGVSTSLWMVAAQLPEFPPLAGDSETDICVIGAGIAGPTTAHHLVQEGKRV